MANYPETCDECEAARDLLVAFLRTQFRYFELRGYLHSYDLLDDALNGMLTEYSGGEVLVDGRWVSSSQLRQLNHKAVRALALAALRDQGLLRTLPPWTRVERLLDKLCLDCDCSRRLRLELEQYL